MKIKTYIGNIRRRNFDKKNKIVFDYTGQAASDAIYNLLASGNPAMICRFGSGELESLCRIMTHQSNRSTIVKFFDYFFGKSSVFLPRNDDFTGLRNNAGVFNIDEAGLNDFRDVYLQAIPLIDILGSWRKDEYNPFIRPYFPNKMIRIPLGCIEPYSADNPWSRLLAGKNVLVIHPFAESIASQYARHDKLFENKDILPDFNLITLKAVQTIAGQETPFPTWLDALNYMKNQINDIDFDIALIGCGAYGMPLAAHCKSIGKQAVHIGGATQILFGIKGARWDETPLSKFYNEYWTRPLESEKPKNLGSVENGCYW